MKKQLLWLALLIAMLATCKHKDPEPALPPETQEGKNTFGCILNGQLWTNSQRQGGSPATLEAVPEADGILSIRAFQRDNGRNENISFFAQKIDKVGTYPISTTTSARFVDREKSIDYGSIDNDIIYSGELVITRFDIPNRIVAGRFNFKLQKQDGLTFEATEGRFDLEMN